MMEQPRDNKELKVTEFSEATHPIVLLLKDNDKDIAQKIKELQELCKNKKMDIVQYIEYNFGAYNNILHYLINRLSGWGQSLNKETIIKFINTILGEVPKQSDKSDKNLKQGPKKLDKTHQAALKILLGQTDSEGQTVLAQAVALGNVGLAEQLLQLEADPNIYMWDNEELIKDLEARKKNKYKYKLNPVTDDLLQSLKEQQLISLLSHAIHDKNDQMITLLKKFLFDSLAKSQGEKILQCDIKFLTQYINNNIADKKQEIIDEFKVLFSQANKNNQTIIMRIFAQQKPLLLKTLLHDYKKPQEPGDFEELCNRFFMYCTSVELKNVEKEVTLDAQALINEFIADHKSGAINLFNLLQQDPISIIEITSLLEQGVWLNYNVVENYNIEHLITADGQDRPTKKNYVSKERLESYILPYHIVRFKGESAILLAAKANNIQLIELLLRYGADVNVLDGQVSPLHYYVRDKSDCIEMIELLLQYNADINFKVDQQYGSSPLHCAAESGNIALVKFLLKKGADSQLVDEYGSSILHYAKNTEIAKLLVQNGADVHILNDDGESPLHWKASANKTAMIEFFLQQGVSANVQDKFGNPPLYSAVLWSDTKEAVQLLVQNGADVNILNKDGQSPLFRAVLSDWTIEEATVLLKNKANINLKDKDGNTPLHHALICCTDESAEGKIWNKKVIILLVQQGADLFIKNNEGMTPLDIAKEGQRENKEFIESSDIEEERQRYANCLSPVDAAIKNEKKYQKLITVLEKAEEKQALLPSTEIRYHEAEANIVKEGKQEVFK